MDIYFILRDKIQHQHVSFCYLNYSCFAHGDSFKMASLWHGADNKESACSEGTWVHPWIRKIPWRREWLPTPCTERIPYTEEPGGLQLIGWQRVGHDWASSTRLTLFWGLHYFLGFPGGSDGKESTCNAGDLGSTPSLRRSPREGHGNHSSILAWRISMDRGTWQSTVHGVAKSRTRLSDWAQHNYFLAS